MFTLPTDSDARKAIPLASACDDFFPAALAGVAMHSASVGAAKHNAGAAPFHARGRSSDHRDCIRRHMVDIADIQAQMMRGGSTAELKKMLRTELNALCWRALAWSQESAETFDGAPLAPAARLPEPPPRVYGGHDADDDTHR